MGPHDTWFHLIPGVKNLQAALGHAMGESWIGGAPVHDLHHVVMGLFVTLILLVVGVRYRAAITSAGESVVVPETRLGLRNLVEIICEAALSMMTGVMGAKAARRFLPLIGTFAFFILASNLLGLVPGFLASTDTLSTTAACAVVIFVATHVYGVKEHGLPYFKHFLGPVWWLAWLLLPIELISHLARPMSLSLRLMGNMTGDHKVLSIFLGLVPLIVPLPIMVLGIIVSVVQTLVFCLLSVVYIALAIEHHEE